MTFLWGGLLFLFVPLFFIFLYARDLGIKRSDTLIMALLLLALSRPSIFHQSSESKIKSIELVIALDASYSMQAKDLTPNRYEFAKKSIFELIDMVPNADIMPIIFTTNALIISPPTTDSIIVKEAIEAFRPEYLLTKGTSLESIFETLHSVPSEQRTVVIFTDGGEQKHIEAYKSNSAKQRVIIVATGTKYGALLKDMSGRSIKRKDGNMLISKLNPNMKYIAKLLNAKIVYTAHKDQKSVAQEIKEALLDTSRYITKSKKEYKEYFYVPLLFAFILFMLLHTRAKKYILAIFLSASLPLNASFLDMLYTQRGIDSYRANDLNKTLLYVKKIKNMTLQSELLRAAMHYRLHHYKKAYEIYAKIKSKDTDTKEMIYYNMARCDIVMRRYKDARGLLAKALVLDPTDTDAMRELEKIVFKKDLKDIKKPTKNSAGTAAASATVGDKGSGGKSKKSNSNGGGGAKKSDASVAKSEKKSKTDAGHKRPLGSKLYELINKGYIDEKKPW